jgi:tight adherence protein B
MVFAIVIAAIVWIATIACWFLMNRASQNASVQKAKSRLTGTTPQKKQKTDSKQPALFETEHAGKQAQVVIGILRKWNLNEKAETLLEQAGVKWKLPRLIYMCLTSCIAVFVIGYMFAPDVLRPYLFIVALAAAAVPLWYVFRLRRKRLAAFEGVFPDCLEFIARSMRAGHAFSVSLEMIYREFQEPLAGEFRRTFEEHNLGLPLEVALLKLVKRVPLLDVQFFVSAVLLQKRTGGNLSEILDKLAYVIRERFKLRGRIRAISAHGKMTGISLTCIPTAVGVLMFFINKEYVNFFFTDPIGQLMIGGALTLQLIGYLIIKQIVKIEV